MENNVQLTFFSKEEDKELFTSSISLETFSKLQKIAEKKNLSMEELIISILEEEMH